MNVVTKITEALLSEEAHRFGCLMLHTPIPWWGEAQRLIPESAVYDTPDHDFGRTKRPHVTCLYGFHPEVTAKDVAPILADFRPVHFSIVGVDCLHADPEYNAAVFKIESEQLHELNQRLRALPHTNTYPEYVPHMTLSYIKPGLDRDVDASFRPIRFRAGRFRFSNASGSETIL